MYTDCYNATRYDIQKHIWKIVNLMSCSTVFFQQGRPLSFKTFLIWVLISIYQGKEQSNQTDNLNEKQTYRQTYNANILYQRVTTLHTYSHCFGALRLVCRCTRHQIRHQDEEQMSNSGRQTNQTLTNKDKRRYLLRETLLFNSPHTFFLIC